MKRIFNILSVSVVALLLCWSCESGDIVGGSVNSTEPVDMTTFDWLAAQPETAVVAQLFDKAGLKSAVNDQVTVIAPNCWSVSRYLRRKNSINNKPADQPEFTLESIGADELAKMKMYIFPGEWWRKTIPEKGVYMTSIDGKQEVYMTLDKTNSDPGAAYDGGNAAGAGFQYSNFLMSQPYMIHVLFKRGQNWEYDYKERLNIGLDGEECDQSYRMYVSDVRTNTGIVHVLYMGDNIYSEHYYYHTLFFYGTRQDDK